MNRSPNTAPILSSESVVSRPVPLTNRCNWLASTPLRPVTLVLIFDPRRLADRLPPGSDRSSNRDRGDDFSLDHFVGQFAMRPVVDGAVGVLRRFVSGEQDLRHLLGEALRDALLKTCSMARVSATVDARHSIAPRVKGLLPPAPPYADLIGMQSDFYRNVLIEHFVKRP